MTHLSTFAPHRYANSGINVIFGAVNWARGAGAPSSASERNEEIEDSRFLTETNGKSLFSSMAF